MRRKRVVAALVGCVLAVVACGGGNDSANDQGGETAASVSTTNQTTTTTVADFDQEVDENAVEAEPYDDASSPATAADPNELQGANGAPTAPAQEYTDPTELYTDPAAQQFPQVRYNQIPQTSTDPATSMETVQSYANDWIGFIDQRLWAPWIRSFGYQEPEVGLIYIGSSQYPTGYTTQCTDPDGNHPTITYDMANAVFCGLDNVTGSDGTVFEGSLLLPLEGLRQFMLGNAGNGRYNLPGDYAAGLIIFHEYGHHVMNELVLQGGYFHPNWKWVELLADCYAGVSTYSVYQAGYLHAGDVDEAINVLEIMADYDVLRPDHHGTPEERTRAFKIGLYGLSTKPDGTPITPVPGSPANCNQEFWKQNPEFN